MSLASLFGVELPIVQAPMAGVQLHALALAVSNAGGLGSLPCAMLDPAALGRELAALAGGTRHPFNVNFFVHVPPAQDAAREATWRAALAPYYAEFGVDAHAIAAGPGRQPFTKEVADVLDAIRPAVVSFHFGLPDPGLVARVKSWGSKVISSATTVDEARWLERHGVDAVIAQGIEAGGHRGMFLTGDLTTQVGTLALVPQVVRAVRVPVIAAGGIADGRGVAAALTLGASGVQIGTGFLATAESNASAPHRAALASPGARVTVLTRLFSGRHGRSIANGFTREMASAEAEVPAYPLQNALMLPIRRAAAASGNPDRLNLWSGQAAALTRPRAAAEYLETLVREAGEALARRDG